MILDPILLTLSVMRRSVVVCSAEDGAWPFPGGIVQLTMEKDKVEEKVERIAEDLRCKYLPLYFYLHSVGRMLSARLLFYRVSAPGA